MVSQFIAGLPSDVLIHIFIKMHPLDVIQLRQTCKDLYNISMERSVWLGLVRRVRDERHLFLPDHLLQRFSLHDLEAAATSSVRWPALTMSPRNGRTAGALHPVRKRVFCLMDYLDRLQERPAETDAFSLYNLEAHLVPGGQYLVTWSGRWLSLWYIGSADTDAPPLVAVTCVEDCRPADERTGTRQYGMTVQAKSAGEGLKVLVFSHHAESIWRCIIYDIDISANMPSFRKVAMLDGPVDTPIGGYTLSGDILVAVFPTHEIWVWNFVQNAWAKWYGGLGRQDSCALINHDYLFLMDKYLGDSDFYNSRLFRIPDLLKLPRDTRPANTLPVSSLPPIACDFLSPLQYRGHVLEDISPASEWRISSPGDQIFLTRRTVHSEANTFLQILEIKLDMDGDVPSVTCVPSQIPCINMDAYRCGITFSGESLTDFVVVRDFSNIRAYTQRASLLLSTQGVRDVDELPGAHVIGEVASAFAMAGSVVGFSPAAGRISFIPSHSGHEVHVLDFMWPLLGQWHPVNSFEYPLDATKGKDYLELFFVSRS